jgi:hypothetical protein
MFFTVPRYRFFSTITNNAPKCADMIIQSLKPWVLHTSRPAPPPPPYFGGTYACTKFQSDPFCREQG